MLRPAGEIRTRFAPSPTGPLHLGHLAAMMYVWGLADRLQATVDVRIEDHDRQRCRPEFTAELREVLTRFGFVPVRGGVWSQQSTREDRYQAALARLREQGVVYACQCSRKDLQSADDGSGERRYPGTCRTLQLPESEGLSLRVRLPDESVRFYDARHGWQVQHPASQCGDPVIRDRLGQWTYQFAVTVDDWHDGINWIIRGDDLLASTGRQLLLARLLGRIAPLHLFHHPLLTNAQGVKLSKSDQAAPLQDLLAEGQAVESILGLAAHRCRLIPHPTPVPRAALAALVDSGNGDRLLVAPFQFV